MSIQYIPSIAEGAYWIRNKSMKWAFGLGRTPCRGNTALVGQDQYPLRQVLTDQSQMWLVEPLPNGRHFRIRNAQLGFLLGVSESSTADGASVILFTPNGDSDQNQEWAIEWVTVNGSSGAPYYRIINVKAKNCLTQWTTRDNPIVSSSWDNGDHQRWSFEPVVFPPVYWISHAETGWYLQYDKLKGAIVANKIASTASTRSQLWYLESDKESDAYVIRSVEDDTKVINLCDSSPGAPVIAYPFHGRENQRWVIKDIITRNPEEDRVKIYSTLAYKVIQLQQPSGSPSCGTLQAQPDKSDTSQSWRLHQYPFPPVYWTTVQNLETETLLKQKGSAVTPFSGAVSALDFNAHWRFVPDRMQPHHYRLVNRATGWVVLEDGTSVTAAERHQEGRDLWAIERTGQGIAIVNTSTGNILGHCDGDTLVTTLPSSRIAEPCHHWVTVQLSDRVPSFAIINARTGRALTSKSSTAEQSVLSSAGAVNDWNNQWSLENLSDLDGSGSPLYAIVNKASGTALEHVVHIPHVGAHRDTSDCQSHDGQQWQLLPSSCGERYFQIKNVGSGHFLEERSTGVPNANATNQTESDTSQLWELVSTRLGKFDLITADDDILQCVLPYARPDIASELGRHILRRVVSGCVKKNQRKDTHKPKNARPLQDFAAETAYAFEHAIGKWTDDIIKTDMLKQRETYMLSVMRSKLEAKTQIMLPRGLRPSSNLPSWIHIGIERTCESSPGQRIANIRGQWNNISVFHVIVPIDVDVGHQIIQDAMRLSLRQHTSVIIEATNNTPSCGGPKLGTTPAPPPGPSGMRGNGWNYFAVPLAPILLSSLDP